MESECSQPCSQKSTTGPNPEPDESSPYHPILFLLRSIPKLSSQLCLGFPSDLFTCSFPIKIVYEHNISQNISILRWEDDEIFTQLGAIDRRSLNLFILQDLVIEIRSVWWAQLSRCLCTYSPDDGSSSSFRNLALF
jgi:hypothetical protein